MGLTAVNQRWRLVRLWPPMHRVSTSTQIWVDSRMSWVLRQVGEGAGEWVIGYEGKGECIHPVKQFKKLRFWIYSSYSCSVFFWSLADTYEGLGRVRNVGRRNNTAKDVLTRGQPTCNYGTEQSSKGFRYSECYKWLPYHVQYGCWTYLVDSTQSEYFWENPKPIQFIILGRTSGVDLLLCLAHPLGED